MRAHSIPEGGYVNHDLFWRSLTPFGKELEEAAATIQERRLFSAIEKVFGSVDAMKAGFTAAASRLFGSGWTFLYWDKQLQSLEITNTSGHDSPAFSPTKVPLLLLDMWEHVSAIRIRMRMPQHAVVAEECTDICTT